MSQSDQIQTLKSSTETSQAALSQDDDPNFLRKQLRQVDNEYKKTKAVLEQRIAQMELQISEYVERESNLKKMNESMMSAISEIGHKNDTSIINKAVKELEVATDQHNKEMQEYRNRTMEQMKGLEFENNKLKQINNENESLIKELKLQFEKNQLSFNTKLNELENDKATLEISIKRLEEEKRQAKDFMGYEIQMKLNEARSQNEKLKEEHRREVEKISRDYDKTLQDLKNIFAEEKRLLEARIEKMQGLIKDQSEVDITAAVEEAKAQHKNELEEMSRLFNEFKIKHQEEVEEARRQRDDALDKYGKSENNLQKLRVALRNAQSIQEQNSKIVKQKIDKAKNVMEQGENLVEENKKYKQKVIELKAQVKKLEASEKKLKDLILDKEIKIDEERIEFKKLLTSEQKFLAQSVSELAQSRILHKSTISQNPIDEPDFLTSDLMSKSVSLGLVNSSLKSSQIQNDRPERSPTPNKGINSSFSHNPTKYSTSSGVHHTPSKSVVLETITPQQLNNKPTEKSYNSRNPSMDRDYTPKTSQNVPHIPLETSFAEAERSYNEEKAKKAAHSQLAPIPDNDKSPFLEKKPKKTIDIDSIPITYQDYIKKTERSRKSEASEQTLTTDNSRINIEQIMASAAGLMQEQPQFGTSHFLLSEHNEVPSQYKQHYIEDQVTHESEPEQDYPEDPIQHYQDFKRKNQLNIGKSHTRDDLERAPSLMNPLSSVQEYDIRDSFEGQYSIDGASSKNRSSRRSLVSQFHSVENPKANPTESRQRIEERLKGLESKLKDMELKNQGLKVEKDKVQIEFEKLMFELRQAKADTSALDCDQKQEKENALKNEIKFLINKLLKVKNKLEKQSEELNATKLHNNTSTSMSHSQFINQSLNIPPSLTASSNYYGGFSKDKPLTPTELNKSYASHSPLTSNNNLNNSYLECDVTPKKTSLGAAIENFAKNVRSKSNLRYESTGSQSRGGQNQNIPPKDVMNTSISSSVQLLQQQISQRAKTPLLDRSDLKSSQSGIGRDIMRDSLSNQYSGYGNVRKSYK